MQLLKQSTAATVKMGPFLDDTDGKTAETALTISQADIRLSKNGGAFAQTGNAAGATHDENGYYGVPLNTTDTGTLGTLRVTVSKSGALPVWQDFMVVTANVYDTLCSTDQLDVNVTNVAGTPQTGNDNGADINTLLTRLVGTIAAGTHNAQSGDAYARLGAPAGASVSADIADVPTVAEFNARTLPSANYFDPAADTVATVTNLTNAPTSGDLTATMKASVNAEVDTALNTAIPGSPTADSINQRIAAIDDLIQAGGSGDLAAILTDTAEIGAAGAGLTAVPWNAAWDAEVQSECTDALNAYDPPTKAEMDSGFAGLNDITAADVWDSTSALLSLSFESIMDRLYQRLFHKVNITDATGAVAVRNAGDTANVMTETITDDDTTTVKTASAWA